MQPRAFSTARAIVDHIHNWHCGTKEGEWVSMGVMTDKSQGYRLSSGLIYSLPVKCTKGTYQVVDGLPIDLATQERMRLTEQELVEERELAARILQRVSR